MGEVFSRTFSVMGSNPVAIFGIAFLFGALPQSLYSYFLQPMLTNAAINNSLATGVISMGSSIVFLIFTMLVQGAIVQATIAHSKGQRATIGESMSTGLSKAVPLIGLTILLILGLILGGILLIIPAFILYMMWIVAGPALVAEDIGIIQAFGRSRYLTNGARWKIFGLQMAQSILLWIFVVMIGLVSYATGVMQTFGAAMIDGRLPIAVLILSAISGTFTSAFFSTIQTSLYISLREWKDGPQTEALADVFA